jgi:hypothetical protein
MTGPANDWPNTSPAPPDGGRHELYLEDIARRAEQDRAARALADQRRKQQEAANNARRRATETPPNPTSDNSRPGATSVNDMNIELDQHTPGGATARDRAAAIIRRLHKAAPTDLVKEFTGGRLRKPARGETLSITLERQLRKAGITIKPGVDLQRIDDTFAANGIGGHSISVMAKILSRAASRGLALPPSTFSRDLAKALPPESYNAQNDDTRAEDGADLAHDAVRAEGASAEPRQRVSPFTGPHSAPHPASIRNTSALVTQADGQEDPTLTAIKIAQRNPTPLVPGSLGGAAKNPNRADANGS